MLYLNKLKFPIVDNNRPVKITEYHFKLSGQSDCKIPSVQKMKWQTMESAVFSSQQLLIIITELCHYNKIHPKEISRIQHSFVNLYKTPKDNVNA